MAAATGRWNVFVSPGAIVEAEPKARRIALTAATIHNQGELDAWLAGSKAAIEAALKNGPVIL